MVIKPKFRGFICTTAHPEGCAKNVQDQIEYVKAKGALEGPKKVLVIGASTGYGLASRIVSTFGSGAATIGVFLEKPATNNRTASAGWYNTVAFEKAAHNGGYYAKSINGDAFSQEIKEQTVDLIKKDLGQVDLVVYSLAAPRRIHPLTGETHSSVLKPIGQTVTSKTVDVHSGDVSEVTIESATEDEIGDTVAVMGGEDWEIWIRDLNKAGVLASGGVTIAYSYIGPEITRFVYRDGTIGRAKEHLEATAKALSNKLKDINGRAFVSVNKALVTQASSAIPVVPLYISLLYKVMKEKGIHEGCIEQIYRLFQDRLYSTTQAPPPLDEIGRIRLDDWEMRDDVQAEIVQLWERVNSGNISVLSDLEGYKKEFFNLFGFEFEGIDYDEDVEIKNELG